METDRPALEVKWVNGRMEMALPPPGDEVRSAAPRGEQVGDNVITAAAGNAIAGTVNRARELLALIRAADHAEVTEKAKLAEVAREKARASAVLFGVSLTITLNDLAQQHEAATVQLHRAESNRQAAIRELEKLRDRATEDGPPAVRRAIRDRLRAARIERERAAEALLAALAPHLAAVLALDAELDVLDGVRASAAVKKTLAAALPEIFGPAGMVGLERYDPRANRPEPEPATDPRQVKYRPSWRRRGHEREYGISDHDNQWEGD